MPPSTANGWPSLQTSTGRGAAVPGTAGRPGTQSGLRPGTASLRTDLKVAERPVTQQGMSGLKTAGQGPGRQVMDRSYFLNELRAKIRDLHQANEGMRAETAQYESETPVYQKLDRSRNALAADVRRLQSELHVVNFATDRLASGTPAAEVLVEANGLEERNRLDRRKLENIIRERTQVERKAAELQEQQAQAQQALESRVAEMPPESRRRLGQLQQEEVYLLQEKSRLEEQVAQMEAAVSRAEGQVKGSPAKERALQLQEQLRALLDRKYELEAEERKLSAPPEEQKEQLKAKMRRDNADIARQEEALRDLAEEIRGLEAKVQQYSAMRQQQQPGPAAAGTPEDLAEKWEKLLRQEAELASFLESFPTQLAEARTQLQEKEGAVVQQLQEIHRLEEILSTQQLPSAAQFREMRDEFEYKQMQLENAKKTAEQLKASRHLPAPVLSRVLHRCPRSNAPLPPAPPLPRHRSRRRRPGRPSWPTLIASRTRSGLRPRSCSGGSRRWSGRCPRWAVRRRSVP